MPHARRAAARRSAQGQPRRARSLMRRAPMRMRPASWTIGVRRLGLLPPAGDRGRRKDIDEVAGRTRRPVANSGFSRLHRFRLSPRLPDRVVARRVRARRRPDSVMKSFISSANRANSSLRRVGASPPSRDLQQDARSRRPPPSLCRLHPRTDLKQERRGPPRS